MVLAHPIALAPLVLIAAAGCRARDPGVADVSSRGPAAPLADIRPRLDGCRLVLEGEGGVPGAEGGKISKIQKQVPFPSDCRFVTGADGEPQIVETGSGTVLVVASSRPLPGSRWCETRVRAVVFRRGDVLDVLLSRQEQLIRTCSPGPYDEKMFHVLASTAAAW